MIHTRMIAVLLALPLLLAACGPGGVGGEPTPRGKEGTGATDGTSVPGTTDATNAADMTDATSVPGATDGRNTADETNASGANPSAPARLSQDENAIAGFTVGISTPEDVIAKFGEPKYDTATSDTKFNLDDRNLSYDGFMCVFVKDSQDQFLLTQFTVREDIGIEGPRGIHIGMTAEALEALFPRETTRETETRDTTIKYMYVEQVEPVGANAPDRMYPPFGYAAYAKGDSTDVSYNFMSAYDWPLLLPEAEGKPGVLLQVNCKDGKVREITLCAAPVVDS